MSQKKSKVTRGISDQMDVLWPVQVLNFHQLQWSNGSAAEFHWLNLKKTKTKNHRLSCLDNWKEIVESLAKSLTNEDIGKAVCHTT